MTTFQADVLRVRPPPILGAQGCTSLPITTIVLSPQNPLEQPALVLKRAEGLRYTMHAVADLQLGSSCEAMLVRLGTARHRQI